MERSISRGADANIADYYGITPLMIAAINGRQTTVALLVDRGVELNATDPLQKNALDYAIVSKQPEIASYLAKKGMRESKIMIPEKPVNAKDLPPFGCPLEWKWVHYSKGVWFRMPYISFVHATGLVVGTRKPGIKEVLVEPPWSREKADFVAAHVKRMLKFGDVPFELTTYTAQLDSSKSEFPVVIAGITSSGKKRFTMIGKRDQLASNLKSSSMTYTLFTSAKRLESARGNYYARVLLDEGSLVQGVGCVKAPAGHLISAPSWLTW